MKSNITIIFSAEKKAAIYYCTTCYKWKEGGWGIGNSNVITVQNNSETVENVKLQP